MDTTKTKRNKIEDGSTKRKRIPKEVTKQDNDNMLAILETNIAASDDVDNTILDSSSYQLSPETIRNDINTLTIGDSTSQAPMKVTIAAVAAKLWKPDWDTRKHQNSIGGLRSLRTVDHTLVANNLHRLGLYKTSTEGALTRTFERKHAYTMDYPGEIKPLNRKLAFLRIVNRVNEDYSKNLAETILRYFLGLLKIRKSSVDSMLVKSFEPKETISLNTVMILLDNVFDIGTGMSASPTIAFHTMCIIVQPLIWQDINVSLLKHHTASDSSSKSIGDVEAYKGESPFLSAEIKHNLAITDSMILTFSQKTKDVNIRFILTTKKIGSKYTTDNILIGNVSDVILQYLHTCIHIDQSIPKKFISTLRTKMMETTDIGSDNKIKIDEMFTKYVV